MAAPDDRASEGDPAVRAALLAWVFAAFTFGNDAVCFSHCAWGLTRFDISRNWDPTLPSHSAWGPTPTRFDISRNWDPTLQSGTPQFRSGVDVVRVPVSVLDRSRPIAGLTAADFEILDNGVAQTLTGASPLEKLPVDVTLVLDTSASLEGRALDQLKADIRSMANGLQPDDRIRLLTFADNVSDAFGLQPAGAALPLERIQGGGATSLYAALAAALMMPASADRPQLVFAASDAIDNASFLDANRILTLAGYSNAALYLALVDPSEPIVRVDAPTAAGTQETSRIVVPQNQQKGLYTGMRSVTRSTGQYIGGPNLPLLKGIVARTGGVLYERPATGTLPGMFREALDDFRSAYVLTYTPAGVDRAGWHDITVRMKKGKYTIRARKGYDGG
jgi:VWFA-related protein